MDAQTDVKMNFICDCDCKDNKPDNIECQNGGDYNCGVCECADGYSGISRYKKIYFYKYLIVGNTCTCVQAEITEETGTCIQPGSSYGDSLCSGKGKCDECTKTCTCFDWGVNRTVTGDFCECDTDLCPKGPNGLPCAGNGQCDCDTGECRCEEGTYKFI